MKQPILLGAVIAGVGLTVIARTLGIDGMASRAATLAVVVLLLIRAKSAWRRRHAAPPGITGAGQA
jgi:hypothetical protein